MHGYGREVILGVGGGIAAYKSCDLLRRLQDSGFLVTVVPTPSSLNFVGAATWEALSGRRVTTQVFEDVEQVRHVSLARQAQALIIAPATADLIARIAQGRADDLLTNLVLASDVPTLIVPAMHPNMWLDQATQENVQTLRSRGYIVLEPDTGALTSGDTGPGRFPETSRILSEFHALLGSKADYLGKKVLITAGGTREPIDPVRYIGNRSSGKQGYAIARAAVQRGASVTLISANTNLPDIEGIENLRVETAVEMLEVMQERFADTDLLIMAAAVADARPLQMNTDKIKKAHFNEIHLTENPDILKTITVSKDKQIIVAFAAETSVDIEEARGKLESKNADFIYINDVSEGAIFNSDTTSGSLLGRNGVALEITECSKDTLANTLLDQALLKLG